MKTSDLIRKKYRALKLGKIEENIALKLHLSLSSKTNYRVPANDESQLIKKEVNVVKDKNIKKRKPENNEDVHEDGNDGVGFRMDNS